MSFTIDFYGKSDVGLKRTNNEDAYLIKPELNLCLVADGMGGAAAGELASLIFTEAASEVFSKSSRETESDVIAHVQNAFHLANRKILAHVKKNVNHKGMGCTAELLTFFDDKFILGHMGDSRTYCFRKGRLKQLTLDHSLVQDQVNQGLITREEAIVHPMRNVILRAVGIKDSLALDVIRGKILPGDIFMLCSDGLTDMLYDEKIQSVLSLSASLSQKGEQLITLAKMAGGKDNVTVVLSEIK